MNKQKLFSFAAIVLMSLTLALVVGVNSASAVVTGDLPGGDTGAFYVAAYSDPQGNPCSGTPDGGETKYAEHDTVNGDTTYNDHNDYLLDFNDVDATTYIYFCQDGTVNILANITIDHDEGVADHIVDLGRVTGNGVHSNLANDYAVVCNGGTQLNTVNKQITGNTYDQYFAMDSDNTYTDVKVFFDDDLLNACTANGSTATKKEIDRANSLPDNYAIYTTFIPDTLAEGDLHADLDAAQFSLTDGDGYSIGWTIETYTAAGAPDGLDDADDDYDLYYDKPSSGTMTLTIGSVANGTTTISGIDYDKFTAGYDFVNDVTDNADGVPTDIARIMTNMAIGADTNATFTTAIHDTKLYDMYTDIGGAAQTIYFEKPASTVVFQKNVNSLAVGDDTIDVGKISGEAHANLEDVGTADSVRVYSNNACTVELTSQTTQPADAVGVDYEVYFDDTDTVAYMKVVQDASANNTTCGNSVAAASFNASQAVTVDLTIHVNGTVHNDVDIMAVAGDGTSDATSADTCTAYIALAGAGARTYHLYAATSTALQIPLDNSSNVFFTTSTALSTELVERTKDLTVASTTVDIGRMAGALHANLQNTHAGDDVSVYSDSACASALSSEDRIGAAGATYNQYYQQNGATVYLKVSDQDANGTYTSCGEAVGFGSYGDSSSTPVDVLISGTVPDAIDAASGIKLDIAQDDSILILGNIIETDPDTYKIYFAGDGASDIQAFASSAKVLERTGKNYAASASFDIAEYSGSLVDSFYEGGSASVAVYDTYVTAANAFSSTSTITDAGATDDYTVYFEDVAGQESRDIRFTDDSGYVSWINDITASDATIDAGDNIDADLEYFATGTVPVDITWVHVRDSSGAGDPDPFASAVPNASGTYILYVADNSGTPVLKGAGTTTWDANDGADGGKMEYGFQISHGTDVYAYTTAFATFSANDSHSVVKVSGSVPGTAATLNGGTVYAKDLVADACGAVAKTAGEASDAITDGGDVDTYAIYYKAATNMFLIFCDSGTAVDYASTDVTENNFAAGTDKTLNLAAIVGEMDSDFDTGGGARIEVYDDFNSNIVGSTQNSGNDGAGITATENGGSDDYLAYFEQSGSVAELAALTDESGRTEADIIADVAMKITDNTGYVMWVIGIEGTEGTTAPAAGDVITVDLVNDLDGIIPDPGGDTDYVIVQDNTDEFVLGVVVDAGGGTDGYYRLVAPTVASLGGGANGNADYVVENAASDVLNYDTGSAVLSDDTIFDAHKITVTNHADLQDDTEDEIQIYTTATGTSDAACDGTLLSSLSGTLLGATQEVYFKRNGSSSLVVNLKINSRETEDYISCVNTETVQGVRGTAITYSADQLVSGSVATNTTNIYIDADGNSATWEVKATTTTATSPDTYKAYFLGAGDTDLKATNGATTELIRTGKAFGAGGTFNVASVTGSSKTALTTSVVYSDATCTAAISSEAENPTTSYTQFFEGTDATNYYVAVSDGVYATCGSAFQTTNQEASGEDFNVLVTGEVPDLSTYAGDDIRSVGVDNDGGIINHRWSNVVDGGANSIYELHLDSDDAGDGTGDEQINFYPGLNGTGTALLSRQDQDLASTTTLNVAVMHGEADASLESGTNDYVKVCDDNLASITSATAGSCTTYLNTNDSGNGVTIADNGFGGNNDYQAYFVVGADTEAYLEVERTATTTVYSYHRVGSNDAASDIAVNAGDIFNVDLDDKIYGTVVEDFDYSTTIPNVQIDVLTNDDVTTAVRGFSNASGTFFLYDKTGQTRDFSFTKPGLLTKDYGDTTGGTDYDAPFNDTAAFDAVVLAGPTPVEENAAGNGEVEISLTSGMKVTVQYSGGQQYVTDATVALYVCTSTNVVSCGTTLDTCTNPNGDCTRAGDNSAGNGLTGDYYFNGMTAGTYVQVKVTRANYDPMYDPDPSGSASAYLVSASTQNTPIFYIDNPTPGAPVLNTPANGTVTIDTTPALAWIDLGADEDYYEVQVDDSSDFSSLVATGTTNGTTNTWSPAGALTNNTKYYWQVRASDDGGVSRFGNWSNTGYFYVTSGWDTIGAPTTAVSTSQVTITWSAVTGADAYNVYRDSTHTVTTADTLLGSSNGVSFVDYPGTGSWWYAIVAVDEQSNVSTISTQSATTTVDVTSPTEESIFINNDAEYTNSKALSLKIYSEGATTYAFSCEPDVAWSSTTVYTAGTYVTKVFSLENNNGSFGCTNTDGSKIVYVRFADASSNYSYESDTIILDTTAPGVATSTPTVATTGGSSQVTITWTAAVDSGSGVASYSIYRDNNNAVTTGDTKVASLVTDDFIDYPGTGAWFYALVATDNAGNSSAISTQSATATVDVTAPTAVSLVVDSGAVYSNSSTPSVSVSYAAQGATTYTLSCDGSTFTALDGTSPDSINLGTFGGGCTSATGSKVMYVKATDASSNSTMAFDEIFLDNVVPAIGTLTAANTATESTVRLTWTAATDNGSGVDYYSVYRANATGVGTGSTLIVSGVEDLGVTDTPADGTWFYTIIATDNAGNESAIATEKSVTVDTTAPTEESIFINNDAEYTNSKALSLKIYSEGATTYAFSCEPDVAWSSTTVYTAGTYVTKVFSLENNNGSFGCTNTDGSKAVYVRFADASSNYSYESDTIILDTTAPTVGTLTASNTQTERTVTLTWTAATDATAGVDYYNVYRASATGVGTGSTLVVSGLETLGYTDNPEDGTWFYTITAVDNATNESAIATEKSVTVDTTAPTNVVVSIASGVEYTTTTSTTLTLAAVNATNLQLSCDGVSWSTSSAYATSTTMNLNNGSGCVTGDGLKTVYVRMLDAYGNANVATDDIILDTVAPTSVATPVVNVSGGMVTVTWTAASDATAGVDSYAVYRKTSTPVAITDTKVISGLTTLGFTDTPPDNPTYYYAITVTDKAGNTSAIGSSSVSALVDTAGPAPVALTINTDDEYTTSPTTSLIIFAGGSPATTSFSCDGSTWSTGTAYATAATFNIETGAGCSAGDGLKTVYVKFLDASDNASYAFDYITLDTAVNTNLSSLLPGANVTQTATSYTWSWTGAADTGSGLDYYRVDISNDAGATWTYKANEHVLGNTYTLTGLAVNSTGYQIKVTAYDKAGNSGTAVTSVGKLYIGVVPTITSLVAGTISTSTATITWTTDVDGTNNIVEYGATSALGSTATTTTGSTTSHSANLSGLSVNTLYYYRVKSRANGATSTSDILTFTTEPTSVTVTDIGAVETYATAGGGWPDGDAATTDGWSWTFDMTVPTSETSLKMKFANWTGVNGTVAVATNMRFYSAQSSNATSTASARTIATAATYNTTAMTLSSDLDASKGGRQIQVTVEMRVPAATSGGAYSTSYGVYTY